MDPSTLQLYSKILQTNMVLLMQPVAPNIPKQMELQNVLYICTVKDLLNKSKDSYLTILAYRSTPLENGYSPAELLMGRKLRTAIPTTLQTLKPQLPNIS